MYEMQPAKKKSGSSCLGKIFKGILIIVGLFIALVVVVGLFAPTKPPTITVGGSVSVAANTPQPKQVIIAATNTPVPTNTPKPTDIPPTATLTTKQIQDSAQTVTFKELARNTEKHTGELLKFEGKVIQVVEDSGDYQLRVNVTKDEFNHFSDTVFLICPHCPTRPLEDDIVSFVGNVDGRLTYKSVMGGEITLPQLTARVFDVIAAP